MRIVHVLSSIDARAGGPAMAIGGLAPALLRRGMEPWVVSTFFRDDLDTIHQQLIQQGVASTRIGPTTRLLRRHPDIVPKLTEVIATADVVHIHALWEEVQHQAMVIARRLRKPYVVRPCGMLDPWSLAQGGIKKKLYMAARLKRDLRGAAALHFTADVERDLTLPLKLGVPAIVEANGLTFEEFDNLPPAGTFRARFSALGDRPFVLFLSRIHKKKGLDLLIPAFATARRNGAMLVIAGPDDSGYGATVRNLVEEHLLGDEVIFTGMLEGVDRLAAMQDAMLFVLPSYQENFGIVVAEAMATGKPAIISDQVNIYREVVAAGAGAAVPTEVKPLKLQLDRWLGDPALCRAAGERAAAFVRERYDWLNIAQRWIAHYQRLAASSASRTVAAVPEKGPAPAAAAAGPVVLREGLPRIIHVISCLDSRAGGTTKALMDLAVAQSAAGLDVSVVSSFRSDDVVDGNRSYLEARGVKAILIGPTIGKFSSHSSLYPTLRSLTGAHTIFHIHALWEDAQHHAAAVARETGTPIVWMPHGMLDPWSLRQSKWKKRAVMKWRTQKDLESASAFAFTTDIERDLVARLDLPGTRIVEPLGLDFTEFDRAPVRGSFRSKFPQLGDRRIVLFLSRIHPKKGLDLLIPAFAAAGHPNDILVIAGPFADGYRPVIEDMIDRQHLGDRCLLTGMLHGADRLGAMVDASMFVLPSYQENFGLAVAEAVAIGCPTIISDQVNIWRELQEAGCAAVVKTQVAPLTAIMTRWLGNDSLRHAAAERGKAFARQRYDWSRIANNWVGYYQDVMQRSARKA
ncbi:MAG TPA: glycosyltransferase [Tepidisphaeraceae bacterium]|nr:glycosyltransferase [Tepidisphaeraceae bacterium]